MKKLLNVGDVVYVMKGNKPLLGIIKELHDEYVGITLANGRRDVVNRGYVVLPSFFEKESTQA